MLVIWVSLTMQDLKNKFDFCALFNRNKKKHNQMVVLFIFYEM